VNSAIIGLRAERGADREQRRAREQHGLPAVQVCEPPEQHRADGHAREARDEHGTERRSLDVPRVDQRGRGERHGLDVEAVEREHRQRQHRDAKREAAEGRRVD
jgi:hypothetical protein